MAKTKRTKPGCYITIVPRSGGRSRTITCEHASLEEVHRLVLEFTERRQFEVLREKLETSDKRSDAA